MTSTGEIVYRPGKNPGEDGHVEVRRPPGPRWVVYLGRLGRVMIGSGLLILAFVAYQLWGTNIQEARAQSRLRGEFTQLITEEPVRIVTTVPTQPVSTSSVVANTPTSTTLVTTTVAAVIAELPEFARGDAVARIEIPKIGVDRIVVSGVSRKDLQNGPGHYPDTPLPGQLGNSAIAGHRTTYGAPFFKVNELATGDEITVTTLTGTYRYVVNADPRIISPSDLSVLKATDEATLTLTSCHPRYSAKQRIVVTATLDTSASSAPIVAPPATTSPLVFVPEVGEGDEEFGTDTPTLSDGDSDGAAVDRDPSTIGQTGDDAASSTVDAPAAAADHLQAGWFSEPEAWFPTIAYAVICFGIGLAGWWYAERWRKLITYALAAIPFVVSLYFFFENLTRLLPPNL